MASKSMKPGQPVRRELTEEEKKQQALRAFMQERKTLIQGIAFNLAANPSVLGKGTTPDEFAGFVISAADALMKAQYTREENKE